MSFNVGFCARIQTFSMALRHSLTFIAVLAVCLCSLKAQYTFQQFEQQFNRNYTDDEREVRRQAFNKNYQELLAQQADPNDNSHVQVNNFTDLTDEEKEKLFSYRPRQLSLSYDSLPKTNKLKAVALPQSLNYSALGKITPIKNQGKCGSCWAFTSTAIYESQLLILGEGEYDLSEQYVLECTPDSDCDGGWPLKALNMFAEKGVPLQSEYPYQADYTAYDSSLICGEDTLTKLNYNISAIKHYSGVSQSSLRQMLSDYGPLSVGINAGDSGFLFYSGGIFSGCGETTQQNQIDHVVLLIGWTKDGHWIVKNSWGTAWGDSGYATINRTRNCGINLFVDALQVQKTTTTTNTSTNVNTSTNTNTNTNTNTSDNTNTTQNTSSSEKLQVSLTDSNGDGWNGYILGVRQNNKIVDVIGQLFLTGKQQGPLEIQVQKGVSSEVIVVVAGSNSKQIGFTIKDSKGNPLCTRKSGMKFNNNIVFCQFCIDCKVNDKVEYLVTLTDAGNDGWNKNILAFKQDGVITTFGEQFVNGPKYGPRKYSFNKKLPVSVVVYRIGSKTEDIGFEISDLSGNVALKRSPGDSLSPAATLGTFCPGCSNLFTVKTSLSAEQQTLLQQAYQAKYSTSTSYKAKPFVIAIAILGAFVFLLGLAITYLAYRIKNPRKASDYPKKDFRAVSILGSSATLPDESPDPAKSLSNIEDANLKSLGSIPDVTLNNQQEFKLN